MLKLGRLIAVLFAKKRIVMIKALSFAALVFSLTACNQTAKNAETTQDSTVNTSEEFVASQDTTHNSRNSVDWAGSYQGTIPCADCPGIKMHVIINEDGTFKLNSEYLERENTFADEGTFTWIKNGSTVLLKGKETNQEFKVGENRLFYLDTEGNLIDGPNADNYILSKVQ